MKKYTVLFLILICLSFNMISIIPAYAANLFKEGVYTVADFNLSKDAHYTVENTSTGGGIGLYVLIFDENQIGQQYIRLKPDTSEKYNLVPLKPGYKLVVLGDGEAYIDKK